MGTVLGLLALRQSFGTYHSNIFKYEF